MTKFLKGFLYALRGILIATQERNMRVHLVVGWIVLLASIYFRITLMEWVAILLCIALVLTLEVINTAIEDLANVCRDVLKAPYEATGKARDLSAGAVLIGAIVAAAVGILIFWPYVVRFV